MERAAAENKSGAEEYVKQLVEHYLDHDAWFRQQMTRGLERAQRLVRKHVKPGTSLVDELLAERRAR